MPGLSKNFIFWICMVSKYGYSCQSECSRTNGKLVSCGIYPRRTLCDLDVSPSDQFHTRAAFSSWIMVNKGMDLVGTTLKQMLESTMKGMLEPAMNPFMIHYVNMSRFFLNMIIKEKTALPSKVPPFSKTAPGRFGSTFFLSVFIFLCYRWIWLIINERDLGEWFQFLTGTGIEPESEK